ncbi:MAG: hypothetical protein AAF596_08995 [Planctomycetota bacterium]
MTAPPQVAAWLLAQRHNWERLGDQFSGKNAKFDLGEVGWLVTLAAGAIVALWVLDRVAKRFEGRAGRPNPGRLFRELCRAHRLKRRERSLLRRLASATGQEHAANLFVRADLFDPATLPDDADALQSLRGRLFGQAA